MNLVVLALSSVWNDVKNVPQYLNASSLLNVTCLLSSAWLPQLLIQLSVY